MRVPQLRITAGVLLFVLLLTGLHTARAQSTTFKVEPDDGSLVKFTSHAQLESFDGTTKRIAGDFTFDPQNLDGGISGKLEVDMTDLSTGNILRDGHMRKDFLEIKNFPRSSFVPKKIIASSMEALPGKQAVNFKLEGDFTLHGVTRTIQPDVTATWNPDTKSLDVDAKWTVLLKDYNIPLPQFVVLKLAQEQNVEVKFTAKQSS